MFAAMRSVRWLCAVLLACAPGPWYEAARAQDPQQDEYATLLEDGRRKLDKGELSSARAAFEEILDAFDEEPEASKPALSAVEEAQLGLLDIRLRQGEYEAVRDALASAPQSMRDRRGAALLHASASSRLGDYAGAMSILQRQLERAPADCQVRHELGELLWHDGQRARAREAWQANADAGRPEDPAQLAFVGRSLWRLGGRANLEAASQALVDSMQRAPLRPEARTTLGVLKFEAYGEAMGFPSGERDLAKVLEENGDVEEALLAMYRIRSANAVLDAAKTERFLDRVFDRNPRSVAAIVLRASNILDDRRYGDAAAMLDSALAIDSNDREALCHRAAAAWLLHDREGYEALRARALAGDPGWPEADRILADHLVALYRFADALPFYAAALAAAPDDVPSLHGMAKALVYTGEGARAKELLERAKSIAAGIVDPWRNNALAVQQLLDAEYTVVEHGPFRLQMHRGDAEVLRAYLLPVCIEAAEVLGAKYEWKPDQPTKVEVLHTWDDFSVRTVGFRGFTALGACFGRLITMVSPVDGDLRKQDFMWEATAWHEYTHVLTLGVSRNRVPRWLTEGFSVYEEKVRDPAWERGMDRELFDAFHNRDIPPVRLLNRLFRGPRILFGYYQGGLIVELIARDHGFEKAIELLRAFGEDLDTEAAFEKALGIPSAKFDEQFLAFVERDKLRSMRLVPRFDDAAMQHLLVRAAQDRTNLQVRVNLAWGCLQRDNPVDAGRWLAEVLRQDPEHGQAMLVRAELMRRRKETQQAIELWQRGFAAGADDFDSRIACGDALLAAGDAAGAADQWQRAKACWPNCTEQASAPELRLARLYREQGDRTRAEMEMKAYCRRTARAYAPRWTLAEFERESGNIAEQARYLVECNRIDPFHRDLHVRLGEAYEALGKRAQAAVEFEMAAAVTPELDRQYAAGGTDRPDADAPEQRQQRGEYWLRAARIRHALGDGARARELLERIRMEASGSAAAGEAEALQQEWQGR
jgi:tetratricopeptide (TPR) repeat protein